MKKKKTTLKFKAHLYLVVIPNAFEASRK